MTSPTSVLNHESAGGRLVTTDGKHLPLRAATVRADARGGVAGVELRQRFHNPHPQPLVVTYQLPLPVDAAVSGYRFQVGDREIVGEVDRRDRARARFEDAILDGHTAALLEQDRSSLFTQEVGNIPPGKELVVTVRLDQRLRWLDEGAWEWRFPTVVAPRYLAGAGRVPDAAAVTTATTADPLSAHVHLELNIADPLRDGATPEGVSHPVQTIAGHDGWRVGFVPESGAALDRDIVIRWATARDTVDARLATARPTDADAHHGGAYGLLTLSPPRSAVPTRAIPRDLIVLIDTSGSMHGEPLGQAKRVVSALVDSLTDHDHLELIEFSMQARRWKRKPKPGTEKMRRAAAAWIAGLSAGGGTEMRTGILEALAGLRPGAQRQVVVVTDGLIGFETEVVRAITDHLPQGSRLHTLGVGSAVNRSLTGPAARAGHGLEVIIGLGEDPERAASRLLARTRAPLVVDLSVSGSAVEDVVPSRLPDLLAGSPALAALRLRPGGGTVTIRGTTPDGRWERELVVSPMDPGSGLRTITTLYGRERVEDLEMLRAAGGDGPDIDAEITRLGLAFQIATRLTSWVAVDPEPSVDPRDPVRREAMPHALPHGMSVEGLGLRAAQTTLAMDSLSTKTGMVPMAAAAPPLPRGAGGPGGIVGRPPARRRTRARRADDAKKHERFEQSDADDFDAETFEPTFRSRTVGPRFRPAPTKRLRGRTVRWDGTTWVVEITIDGTLQWEPLPEPEVHLPAGTVVTVHIEPGYTTKPGRVQTGQIVRLAVSGLSAQPASGTTIVVGSGGFTIEVQVGEVEVG